MSSGDFSGGEAELDIEQLGFAVTDVATAWDARLQQEIEAQALIMAMRGAGSAGGTDERAAANLVDKLGERIDRRLSEGRRIAVLYDGDPHSDQPDIGAIVGDLRTAFDGGVSFLAAQADDWYYPPIPGSNLVNANGRPYETFVFQRGEYDGDHNRFTQSPRLVRYPGYEQVYAGAAGLLAASQMVDYCNSVPEGGPVKVTVMRGMINRALDAEIGEQLLTVTDAAKRAKLLARQEQRQRIFGAHWDNTGRFDPAFLQEVQRPDEDTHQVMVLWEGDEAYVGNFRKIDLNTPDADRMFAEARSYVKTRPITARRVDGAAEWVPTPAAATGDWAQPGDWVCRKQDGEGNFGGEYVVHAATFAAEYDPHAEHSNLFVPKPFPRRMVQVREDVVFMAPWGQLQAVKAEGWLMEREVREGDGTAVERYGISEKDAQEFSLVAQ